MVEVAVSYATRNVRVPRRRVEEAVGLVFKKERIARGRISCIFVDDKTIRKINRKFLGHSSATDVITFPIESLPSPEAEIYVNTEQARRQARQYRVSVPNEVTRLVVHGVLHALGYSDKRTNLRKLMFERQERYVGLCERLSGQI